MLFSAILSTLTKRIFQKVYDSLSDVNAQLAQMSQLADSNEYIRTPVGTVIMCAQSSLGNSSGFLACNGTQYHVSQYPQLASVLGQADGEFFNVPDIQPTAVNIGIAETKLMYYFIKFEPTGY